MELEFLNILIFGIAILLLFLVSFLNPDKSKLIFGIGLFSLCMIVALHLLLITSSTHIESYISLTLTAILSLIFIYSYFKEKNQ